MLHKEARALAHAQLDALVEEDPENLPKFLRLLAGMSRDAGRTQRAHAASLLRQQAIDMIPSVPVGEPELQPPRRASQPPPLSPLMEEEEDDNTDDEEEDEMLRWVRSLPDAEDYARRPELDVDEEDDIDLD